ncbi:MULTISPECIES: DUF6126 family protein [Streptomyces]|uniref:Uncharacterized protein n=2 Tax=Streptomyces TaxID=1883 RepID=A0A2N8PH64_STRNR|nr:MULTISPECIES: DUF6126 family protein [Streptomyces]PNE40349.1 hypothetical protein AOB60_05105 [Streptomyces noursei]SHL45476.1 hypothetical protein SAMN05216268_104355 [Streptomyces yunnanensis]
MTDDHSTARPTDAASSAPDPSFGGGMSEARKERGASVRVFLYIAGSHLLLGFMALLFYLGSHAQK